MAQAKDIVVTAGTYALLTPSSGDRVPAQWRFVDINATHAERPTFEVVSKYSANRQYRVLDMALRFPIIAKMADGQVLRKSLGSVKITAALPLDAKDGEITNLVEQLIDLVKSSDVKDALVSGYAPT